MLQGVGISIPETPLSGNWIGFEIVDVRNNIRMFYQYFEGVGGLGFSLPVSWGGRSSWEDIHTAPFELHISHFGGPVIHAGFGIQPGVGYTDDVFILLGPTNHGSDDVAVRFRGSWSERGFSVGGGVNLLGDMRPAGAAMIVPGGNGDVYSTGNRPPWEPPGTQPTH